MDLPHLTDREAGVQRGGWQLVGHLLDGEARIGILTTMAGLGDVLRSGIPTLGSLRSSEHHDRTTAPRAWSLRVSRWGRP